MSEKHDAQPVTKAPFVSQSHDGNANWKTDEGTNEENSLSLFFLFRDTLSSWIDGLVGTNDGVI